MSGQHEVDGAKVGVTVLAKLAQTKKLIVHIATVASALLALGVLPEQVAVWVIAALGFLSSVGLYSVKNARSQH